MFVLIRRLLRLEAGVSVWQALADYFTEYAIAWVAWLGGGGVMAYLAAITAWLRPWGPIGWGVAFFVGAILAVAIYAAVVWVSSHRLRNRFIRRSLETSPINPLLGKFDHERIRLDIFYNPY
jgi:hypothetical protein